MLKINLQYDWENFHANYCVEISPGVTTLLGGSGEGKSTLLHLLGGFLDGRGELFSTKNHCFLYPLTKGQYRPYFKVIIYFRN
ncbi:hypothetical protein AB8E32_11225 [Marinomonas polaris]|uniref:hypothetical protein n=1 Tax=Marinomonas polaris TaxID=293552 RepID=UPI0035128233